MKKNKNSEMYKITSPIITYTRGNGQYLFDKENFTDEIIIGENIVIPTNVDTEYWQSNYGQYLRDANFLSFTSPKYEKYKFEYLNYWNKGRVGVTSQIKGIFDDEKIILCHPDMEEIGNKLGKSLRHPIAQSGFHLVDWMNEIGIKTKLHHREKVTKENSKGETIPSCEFVIYSHFALAEFLMIANGEYRQDLRKLCLSDKKSRVEMQRRLRVVTSGKYGDSDNIDLPWIIYIEGHMYRVKLCVVDSFAIHGVASYKDLCEAAGIRLESKSLMDSYKSMMHIGYFECPEEYDSYALGDLHIYEALSKNAENFKKIWESLEIGDYYECPKLTIGATVRDIFQAKVCKEFGLNPNGLDNRLSNLLRLDENKKESFQNYRKKLLETVCQWGTAEYLKQFTTSTKALNAKVEGGRCRNNRPNIVKLQGTLLDIDYSGCYGEGQRNQLYPFGRPLIDEYDYPSKINNYPTLRKWLKSRKWGNEKCELVPGLWSARVSTKEIWNGDDVTYAELKTPQDYLASWFDFKIKDIADLKTDTEIEDAPENQYLEVKTGLTKIFNSQVINAVITHDFVDWLFNVCGEKQRNELLDNLYIHTAIYYPTYDRVNSPLELLEKIVNHEGVNNSKTAPRKGGSKAIKITQECTAWYAVNLGEFIIDDLLAWRKIYPKKNADNSKNPMNTLYKLCVNTLYGDMVSPFFNIGNVVVGNNITARARAACYYAEKGFNGVQSITDGVCFDLNNVVYPNGERRVTGESVVNLHRLENRDVNRIRNLKLAPIGNYDNIELNWITTDKIDGKGKFIKLPSLKLIKGENIEFITPIKGENDNWNNPAHEWIDKNAMIHLQSIFNVDVLQANTTALKVKNINGKPVKTYIPMKGMFVFEAKSFYDKGVFHGTANYQLKGEGGDNMAMRSYENKKEHDTIEANGNELNIKPYPDGKKPAQFFLDELENNPTNIRRGRVFIKQGILKINDARNNNVRWSNVGREVGDSIEKSGLLREFSLSQFTFKNIEQFKNISREVESNKRKFNQSYEGFFVNQDGTLNFQLMIHEIDLLIGNGELSLNKIFDKSRNRHRNKDIHHPDSAVLEIVRSSLLKPSMDANERDFFEMTILSDEEGTTYPINRDDYPDWEYRDSGLYATAEDLGDFEINLDF
jgi:hypothetical protein